MKFLKWTAGLLFFGSICLYALPSAVFHTTFDRDFSALTHNGTVSGKYSAGALWENLATYLKEGVEGTGALIGTGNEKKEDYHIEYVNRDYILPDKGSIVFWIQPGNWQGNDRKFHVFFRAEGPDANLIVYKVTWSDELYFLMGPYKKKDGKYQYTSVTAPAGDWKPGEWHFVCATWGEGEMQLYLDGVGRKPEKYAVPGSSFNHFGIGGRRPLDWTTPMGFSVIDELMLYNCRLTQEDVLTRYRAYRQSKVVTTDESKVNPVNIVSGYIPEKQVLALDFQVKEVSPDRKFYTAEVVLKNQTENICWKQLLSPMSTEYHGEVPLASLKPGNYDFCITIQKKNKSLNKTVVHPVGIPARPEVWRREKAGAEPTVPPPWTKPEWNGRKGIFSCWNREYVFGEALMPRQIISGKRELFVRPVDLRLNGQTLKIGALRMKERTDERICLIGHGVAEDFEIRADIYGEFDGFFWVDLTLQAKKQGAVIRSLTLDFPFAKENSTLYNAMKKSYAEYFPGDAGNFRRYSSNLFSEGSRTIFVGNDHVGLEWFCEELSSWNIKNQKNSLQLLPEKNANRLLLTMVDKATLPGKNHRFRFGFQALPVKAMPDQWRLLRADGYGRKGFVPWFPWSSIHNVPDPELKLPNFEKIWKKMEKQSAVHWYFAGFSISPYFPEWSFYGPMWSQTPPAVGVVGAANSRQWAFARSCPEGDGYIDWYVYSLRNTVRKAGIQHLYFDNQDPQFCNNIRHGCSWIGTDGSRYKTYNLLATRELVKRIYRMFKKERPDGLIMRHMSTKTITPIVGFCDTMADGEMYCSTVGREESYKSIFEPGMFRAMFRAQPYGIPRFFIPQFQRAIRSHSPIKNRYEKDWNNSKLGEHQDVLRHFKGYFLVHDAQIWPCFGISCKDWWKIQDDFGIDGTEKFIYYADAESPFKTIDKVMVSYYVKDGRALLIIMNDTEVNKPLVIRIDQSKLIQSGVKSLKNLLDCENGQTVECDGNILKIAVPPRNYRLLKTL